MHPDDDALALGPRRARALGRRWAGARRTTTLGRFLGRMARSWAQQCLFLDWPVFCERHVAERAPRPRHTKRHSLLKCFSSSSSASSSRARALT